MVITDIERQLSAPLPQSEAARRLGWSRQLLHQWLDRLIVEPLGRQGIDPPSSVSLQTIWSVCIGRSVRSAGGTLEAATNACKFLEGMPPHEVDRAFREERTILFLVGDQPMPMLMTEESTYADHLREMWELARQHGVAPVLMRIDCLPLFYQLSELSKDAC